MRGLLQRRRTAAPHVRLRRSISGADRLTLGLAIVAVGSAGTLIGLEYGRRLHRRLVREESSPSGRDGHADAVLVASRAGQDAVRVAVRGYSSASRQEAVLFNLLSGFMASFAIARISTTGIRAGWWPLGDVEVGGRHIHHFVPGILVAFGSATAALVTDDLDHETALAFPFGVGVGLTFDEAALLLDLRDVYWSREGLLSVQISLGAAVLLTGTIIALRMLRRGEEQIEAEGLIPDEQGAFLAPTAASPARGD